MKSLIGKMTIIVMLFISFSGIAVFILDKTGSLASSNSESNTTLTEPAKTTINPTASESITITPEPSVLPTEAIFPTATPLPTEITDNFGVEMVLVPAGEFLMGNNEGAEDEKPAHVVYLDTYYIDKFEVTNSQYKDCVDAEVCDPQKRVESVTRSNYYGKAEFDNYPVIGINWNWANTFCAWRGAGLPSEAQWEKAARGGLDGQTYPWGNEAPVCQKGVENGANFDDNDLCNDVDTKMVGEYMPNGYVSSIITSWTKVAP
jgi:formylglycine-generating enzyme required for sulfatase activity